MGVRKELAPQVGDRRTYLPSACYNLRKEEKRRICETLASIKVFDGYCSNICSLVSTKDLRLIGLKSHNCLPLMQQLLPVALRVIDQKHVRYTITKLCLFFNSICGKTVDVSKLHSIQKDIIHTLCLFEQYFIVFDILIHLKVHLVRDIELCELVYIR